MSSLVEGRGWCGIGPRRSAAQSTPLYTFRTPGIARARAASTRTRRACGWGERTITAWAWRAMLKSSVNRPAPVKRRRSSLRRSGSPIAPAAAPSGLLRSFTARLLSCVQMLAEEIDRKRKRPVRLGLAVSPAAVARESVIGAGILVDRDPGNRREPALEQLVHFRLHPAVFHRHVQHEGPVQALRFADVVLDVGAVVGHRAIDVGAAAHEIAELAAEAVADRADLAAALLHLLQVRGRVLHVAHAEVVVEVVIKVERFFHVLGVFVVELDARFLAPEEVGHEAHETRFGEFLRVPAHGVVDAPDFHDSDDRGSRRARGERDVRAHFAVPQTDANVLGPHQLSFRSARALPAKIRSFSALGISRPFTALIVSRISIRPCSASNGASVAKRQWPVVKNSCPHRVAATEPLSEVSA